MAKKRRTKRRKGSRLRPPNSQTSTMSSEDSYALQSGRQSSDGTMSEHATSEGAQTAMTSIMDTDEEEMVDELEVDEDEDDMISIYPMSHYPGKNHYGAGQRVFSSAESRIDEDVAASTRSLWDQDLDYREIHGRRYCREYFMPTDDLEQTRLTLQHQVFIHVLHGELTLAPIQDPTHILDVGTGTGDWAIKMAEIYPDCDVVGTDIAAIAETQSVPVNVFFEIEDAEDWDRPPEKYDLIHFRLMEGAFQNWQFIYDNVFYSLKPGGWVEIQDYDSAEGFQAFLNMFPPEAALHAITRDLAAAAAKSGRPRGTAHLDPTLLMDAGFVDVRTTEYVIPITVAEQSAGKIWLVSCLDAMEANCLRLLTTYEGWDPETCKEKCEQAARELAGLAKNPEKAKGLSIKLRVVTARKPDGNSDSGLSSAVEKAMTPNSKPAADADDEESPDPTLHAVTDGVLESHEAMDTSPDEAPVSAEAPSGDGKA